MMIVYIYVLKHPETKEIRYVGLTRFPAKRYANECAYPHTLHFKNWINKLKEDGLKPEMEIIETSDEDNASERERVWIKFYRDGGSRLLNFTSGGERGFSMDESVRAKFRVLNRRKRRPMSEDHKAKISAANKGNPRDYLKGSIPWNKGKKMAPMTEEAKDHLREFMKVNFTAEWKEKLRQGSINSKRKSICTDEQKSQIKRLIVEGYSIRVIAEAYGISMGTVSCVRLNQMWAGVHPSNEDFLRPPYKTIVDSRRTEGVCGTAAKYTRGCRCDECRKAHNAVNTEWKRKKRRDLLAALAERTNLAA